MRTSTWLTVIGFCVLLGNGRGNAAEAIPVRDATAQAVADTNWGFEESPAGQYSVTSPGGAAKQRPLVELAPWELVAASTGQNGVVAIVEGDAPEGKRYLRTVSFSPFIQRRLSTVAGQEYRIRFQLRVDGPLLDTLVVHWNDTPMRVTGTPEWKEHTLTVKAAGQDVLKFQRTNKSHPCLDAIQVEALRP